MKRAYIDVETTGVDPKTGDLVQLAMIIEIDDEMVEAINLTCRPFIADVINPSALEVLNKSAAELHDLQDPTAAHLQLLNILGKYVDRFDPSDKFVFVGYNSHFDDAFLREWFKKCGDKYYGSWFWWPPLDVAQFAMEYLRDRRAGMPNFKLGTVAVELGLDLTDADLHDARTDVGVTYDMYQLMLGGRE